MRDGAYPGGSLPPFPARELDARFRERLAWLGEAVLALVSGGKRLRARLAWLVSGGRVPSGALAAIELAHAASLVHDDVLDGEGLRRGQATLQRLSGNHEAILSGDALLVEALTEAAALADAAFFTALLDALRETCRGEILQDRLARAAAPPDWESYHASIAGKTGALFGLAGFCGAHFGGQGRDPLLWRRLALRLGIAYQLFDDLEDQERDVAGEGFAVNRLAGGPALVNRKLSEALEALWQDCRDAGIEEELCGMLWSECGFATCRGYR